MKSTLLLALALAFAPLTAAADGLSYTYVEAGYAHTDIDGIGDGGGAGVNASVALGDRFHLFGSFSAEQGSESSIEVDLDTYRLGAGYRYAFGEATNLEFNAYYENLSIDATDGFDSVDAEVDGYGVEAGVRGKMVPRLEGWAYLGYAKADDGSVGFEGEEFDVDLSDENANVYGRVGAQFNLNATWGIVAHVAFDDDVVRSFAGIRASF